MAEYDVPRCQISLQECYCVKEKLKLVNEIQNVSVFNKLLVKY